MPIYERYMDEASFLWVLRGVAFDQPHYLPEDLHELEERINRQLDGIMTAPNDAWSVCESALALLEPGEVFASAVIAFRCGDIDKIQQAVETGQSDTTTLAALASALNWVSGSQSHEWVRKFFASKNFKHKCLALDVCSLRGENPSDYLRAILEREDCRADKLLYARAIKSAGEFKRHDLMSSIITACDDDDSEVKFWALWASALLGDRSRVAELKPYVIEPGRYRSPAIQLAFRILPLLDARAWIGELAQAEHSVRDVIKATTVLGDPHAVTWLAAQMREVSLSRLAGESFSTITGIDLSEHNLINELPDLEELLHDDEDAAIGLDEDENLPFPVAEKVAAVWQKYGQKFSPGKRYFLGKLIDTNLLEQTVNYGSARNRHMAALELALIDKHMPLKNTYSKVS